MALLFIELYNSAASNAPIIVEIKKAGRLKYSPEMIFGPRVLAGFMDAPVNLPKINARIPTTEPTQIDTIFVLSVLEIIR